MHGKLSLFAWNSPKLVIEEKNSVLSNQVLMCCYGLPKV